MDDMLKEFVVEAMDLATNVEEHLLRSNAIRTTRKR